MTQTAEIKNSVPTDVSAQRVAKVYAEALLRATSKDAAENAVRELEDLVKVFREAPQLSALLSSPAVPARVKTESIQKALAAQASPVVGNFLQVLNAHGRFDLLPQIAK